jgi:hypothetical protein
VPADSHDYARKDAATATQISTFHQARSAFTLAQSVMLGSQENQQCR